MDWETETTSFHIFESEGSEVDFLKTSVDYFEVAEKVSGEMFAEKAAAHPKGSVILALQDESDFDPEYRSSDSDIRDYLTKTFTRADAEKIFRDCANSVAAFADNGNISSWAIESVGRVQAAGIMTGVGDNSFAPKDPYTREQSIFTIMGMFGVLDRDNSMPL